MPKTLQDLKQGIREFLSETAGKIMDSYRGYLDKDPDDLKDSDMKKFKTYHDSGKAAATHLEHIMKISKATECPEDSAEAYRQERDFQDALKAARHELSKNIKAVD